MRVCPLTRSSNRAAIQIQVQSPGNVNGAQAGICRFFRQGHCKYEDRCKYSHSFPYGTYPVYPAYMGYATGYSEYGIQSTPQQSQHAQLHQREHRRREGGRSRQTTEESKFVNAEVEQFVGELATLGKDQFGCRFLQRKLEEGASRDQELIFSEVYSHFNELMTGKCLLKPLLKQLA